MSIPEPLETVFQNVITQLHATLTNLSIASAERYEIEAPIIMDVVKYLLRQKQTLTANQTQLSKPRNNNNGASSSPKKSNEQNNTNAVDKSPKIKPKVIVVQKPPEPAEPMQEEQSQSDYFLSNFEMPGKFAAPEPVNKKPAVKVEKTKEFELPRVEDDATILYDSTEQAAAVAMTTKKRKLEDSDEGGAKKKARLESTPQDLFDFLRRAGMTKIVKIQIRRSKHEATAEWEKLAPTPLGLLELFHKEKELEHTAKLNAWTHLYLDEDLVLNAPQSFEKTPYGHFKKFKFTRGTKMDTLRGVMYFSKELEKKSSALEDATQLIFKKNFSFESLCKSHGLSD